MLESLRIPDGEGMPSPYNISISTKKPARNPGRLFDVVEFIRRSKQRSLHPQAELRR